MKVAGHKPGSTTELVSRSTKNLLPRDKGPYEGTGGDRGILAAQMVKNLPAMQETQIRSLDQEDLLKKGMASHSSILAWSIP